MNDRPTKFTIILEPIPGPYPNTPHRRLARFLKTAKRAYGLRCVSAVENNGNGTPSVPVVTDVPGT